MKRYLLSLVFLLLSTMATEAVVNRQCDYTVGSTTTATGFSNCNEELADLSTKAFAIASVTGTDTIIGTSSPTVTTLTDGQMVVFTAAGTTTGAVTFKLDSTSTLSVYQQDGTTALGAGDLVSGTRYILSYKSSTTRWILMGQSGSSGAAPSGAQYLTLALSSSLGAERMFATGSTLSCTDGGANGAYTCGVATNGVGNSQLRQGVALSVIGVTGSSTANVADIAGTANQVLRVNGAGTALAFGQVDLSSSSAVTGALVATSFPALTGDVTTSAGSLATTIAANAVALTTDTTGDYVGGVADGTGIDGTASGEGSTYTPTLDLTEVNSTTFGSGTFTTLTFDAGATDPVFTMASPATATMSGGGTSPIFALDDQGSLQLLEEDAGGSNYIAFQAPAAITSNVTCTLENDSNPIPDSCVGDGSDDDIPDAGEVDDTALAAGAVDGGTGGEIEDGTIDGEDLAASVAGAGLTETAGSPDQIDISLHATGPGLSTSGDVLSLIRTCADGQLLEYTAAGGWACANDDGGAGSGDNVSVNGTAASDADFDDATPAAPAGAFNVKWQKDSGAPNNVSANVDYGAGLTVSGGELIADTSVLGDVDGPGSATDNAITRFDGTTGKLIQNSAVTIADTGDVTATFTDAGASAGPVHDLFRDSASPAASDVIGRQKFSGRDSGAAVQDYAYLQAEITDATAASEDGEVVVQTTAAGTTAQRLRISDQQTYTYNNAAANQGVVNSEHFIALTSDYTLTSATAEQKAFNATTNGALTLPAGTYFFEWFMHIDTMSGTTGNLSSMDILGAGTATVASAKYQTTGMDQTTPTTAATVSGVVSTAAQTSGRPVTGATGTAMMVTAKGIFRLSAGGTIIPSVSLETANAAVMKTNSYFTCHRVGGDTVTNVGNWN